MISKQARLDILRTIFDKYFFNNVEIKLIKNNYVTAEEDCILSTFVTHTSGDFTPLHLPDLSTTFWAFQAASGLNDHNEGEVDSPLVEFTALTVDTPYHIYGFCIIYERSLESGIKYLYGHHRFATPIPIVAAGDFARFYCDVFDDDFIPLGHL